jgi:ribosomal protein S18 acetylase RimI-like enzyme
MMELVRAEEHHLPAIGKLWWEFMLFHQAVDTWFTPREGSVSHFLEHHVSKFMHSDNGLVLVAIENGTVVGYSLSEIQGPSPATKQDKWGYIDQMAVTESYRRRGVGEKMYTEIMAWFEFKGVSRVELELTARNYISYSFWRKHGFKDYMHRLYLERSVKG